MLRSYLTSALRNLRRHRAYTAINALGLAVGIACCLVIFAFVRDELRFDRFHERSDRTYRVVYSTADDGQPTNANSSFSVGPELEQTFPEISESVRFIKMGWGEQRVFAHADRRYYEQAFFFADPSVFDVFSFPLVKGDPETALADPNTLVLTESAARKYFGDEDPVGRALSIDPFNDGRFTDYVITGVLRDVPRTSHIPFDFLLSFSSLPQPVEGWGLDPVFTYVLLNAGADPRPIEAQIALLLDEHFGSDRYFNILLQPLEEIHLHSQLRAELAPNGSMTYVYTFSAIAAFILLIACINFMNLATARSARRAREVGMRKVLGAQRPQLIGQFLSEAALLSLLSALLALPMLALVVPLFNAISGKTLTLGGLLDAQTVLMLGGLTLFIGVMAGSYPAFYLSAFRPIRVLKAGTRGTGRREAALRKGLVVFQFAVSIVLIACTTVVAEQMDYVRSKHLGFDREQVIILPLNDDIRNGYASFRREVLDRPGVLNVALSEQVPARAGNGSSYQMEGLDDRLGATRLFVDEHFVETYGIEIVAGRDFSEEIGTDAADAFIVNQELVRDAGWASDEEAIGKSVEMEWGGEERRGRIVGVARDFHLFSLHGPVTRLVVNVMPLEALNFVSVRLAPGNVSKALAGLEEAWSAFAPNYPFEYYFLDEDFERLHQADQTLGQVFTTFAVLAILVACLGLFALAAFAAEQRTKEIGVRKVLGASAGQMIALLTGDFARLVLIAFVAAVPVAHYAMSRWLEQFAYRIDLSLWMFAVAGALALLIAFATVSYQTFRAAMMDPVKSLRYE